MQIRQRNQTPPASPNPHGTRIQTATPLNSPQKRCLGCVDHAHPSPKRPRINADKETISQLEVDNEKLNDVLRKYKEECNSLIQQLTALRSERNELLNKCASVQQETPMEEEHSHEDVDCSFDNYDDAFPMDDVEADAPQEELPLQEDSELSNLLKKVLEKEKIIQEIQEQLEEFQGKEEELSQQVKESNASKELLKKIMLQQSATCNKIRAEGQAAHNKLMEVEESYGHLEAEFNQTKDNLKSANAKIAEIAKRRTVKASTYSLKKKAFHAVEVGLQLTSGASALAGGAILGFGSSDMLQNTFTFVANSFFDPATATRGYIHLMNNAPTIGTGLGLGAALFYGGYKALEHYNSSEYDFGL